MKDMMAIPLVFLGAMTVGAATHEDPITLKIQRVREVRVLDVPTEGDEPVLSMNSAPALEVSFHIVLPEGLEIASIAQPTQVAATDSTGKDLADIPSGVFGEKEYLEAETFFDTPRLELRLACPARAATTFSATLVAQAILFEGIGSFDIEPSGQWAPLKHPTLEPLKAEARARVEDDGSVKFDVRPPNAREFIKNVVPAADGVEPGGYSITWSDEAATFDVSPTPEKGQKLRVFVLQNVRPAPLRIHIKDQALP